MGKHNRKHSSDLFIELDEDTELAEALLEADISAIALLLRLAKSADLAKEQEIREKIRPLVVELLKLVSDDPKALDKALRELKKLENAYGG